MLEHQGFRGAKLVIVSFVMGQGWKKILGRLASTLDAMDRDEPATSPRASEAHPAL